jgi:HK97 gp10 family phage protein
MADIAIEGGKLDWDGVKFIAEVTDANVKAMTKAAIVVQAKAKELAGGTGSGRKYKRRGITHRASKPNRPPARDTGVLVNSISFAIYKFGKTPGVDLTKAKNLEVIGAVGADHNLLISGNPNTDPDYAIWLELGTHKMKPRPYLRPAVIKSRKTINKIFNDTMRKL